MQKPIEYLNICKKIQLFYRGVTAACDLIPAALGHAVVPVFIQVVFYPGLRVMGTTRAAWVG